MAGLRGGSEAQPRGILFRRERGLRRGPGERVAAIELGGGEGAAVDEEAVDAPGALGERLAEDRGAALLSRALAGGGAAIPADVAGDNSRRGRHRERRRVIAGRCRNGGERDGAKRKDRSKHG